AALTVKPVIGVPLDAGPLKGQDALLSTVQMPGGIPVACVAIGKTGARNAAYLAAEIMALSDRSLASRLVEERKLSAAAIAAKDKSVRERFNR
ncbi:MAG TPA: AIR carboxylase family protein, partial [Burkholderiales bacterium]